MLNGYFKPDKGILSINQGTGMRVFPVLKCTYAFTQTNNLYNVQRVDKYKKVLKWSTKTMQCHTLKALQS